MSDEAKELRDRRIRDIEDRWLHDLTTPVDVKWLLDEVFKLERELKEKRKAERRRR
jgi:hypothetical protein